MQAGGAGTIGERLFDFALAVVGRMRGGLARTLRTGYSMSAVADRVNARANSLAVWPVHATP